MRQGAKWAVLVLSTLTAVSAPAMGAPPKAEPTKSAPAKGAPPKGAPAAASPDDEVATRVADLYAKGNKLYDEQKFAEAEAAYQAAWDLRPSFDLAGNLGDVEIQLGQYRDAAEHITYAIEEFPAGGKPEAREMLNKLLEAARTQIGTVKIATNIGGAKITVDGRFVGQAPLQKAVFVDPGKRVVEARLDGFEDALQTVEVQKGGTHDVSITLNAKGGVGGPGGGKKSMPLIIAGAGLGLVGIGVGVGLIIASSSASDDAIKLESDIDKAGGDGACNPNDSRYPTFKSQCSELSSNLKNVDLYRTVGIGSLVVGGVFALGTIIYAATPSKKRATTGFMVMPTVSPTFAGAGAFGHF